jgi:hypothetical protein
MVLPVDVQPGIAEQQRQPGERQRDGGRPNDGADSASLRGRTVRSEVEPWCVAVLLLLAAVAADTLGGHSISFYLVLAALVVTAHAALQAYGHLVELPGNSPALAAARLQAALGVLALVLVVVAAAVRAPTLDGAVVPPVGVSAVVASVALLLLQGAVRLVER